MRRLLGFLGHRQPELPLNRPDPSDLDRRPKAMPEPRRIEIGEIPVDLKPAICCGVTLWFGQFPDGSRCCEHAPCHADVDEAGQCAAKRVAAGFVVRERPSAESEADQ